MDIDGVLNGMDWFASETYKQRHLKLKSERDPVADGDDYNDGADYNAAYMYGTHFDPACVDLLKGILQRTGAEVVLSSTWRLSEITRAAVAKLDIPIIGVTPPPMKTRGEEIESWLVSNRFAGNFVIIDDYFPDEFGALQDRLVQTCFGRGLMATAAERAIELLMQPEPWSVRGLRVIPSVTVNRQQPSINRHGRVEGYSSTIRPLE
mgnify:CR=1 FL=1